MIPVITVDGLRFQLDQVTYRQSGSSVFISSPGNETAPSISACRNAAEAMYMVQSLDALWNNYGPTPNYAAVSPVTLISVSPNPFDSHTVSPLTVVGTGFDTNFLGKVFIEDIEGRQDDNGTKFDMTFVDTQTLTGVFNTDGDNTSSPSNTYIMYYVDSLGRRSNSLILTSPDNINFTLP